MGSSSSLVFLVWVTVSLLPTRFSFSQCNAKASVNVSVSVSGGWNANSNANANSDSDSNADAETVGESNALNLNWDLNGMHCVCDGECEWLGEGECPWGVTLDFCGCCLLCSRGRGEPCGGAVGTCAKGLVCHKDKLDSSEGICSRIGEQKTCEKPLMEFGCLFHDGDCICELHRICPFTQIFLFPDEQACHSRITLLTKTQKRQSSSSSSSLALSMSLSSNSTSSQY